MPLSGDVTYVRDSDTVEVGGMAIRLSGLAASERDEPGGASAAQAMTELVQDSTVRCELDGERTPDCCAGVCYLDGADIAAVMVRRGLGRGFESFSRGCCRAAERQAAADGATIRERLSRVNVRRSTSAALRAMALRREPLILSRRSLLSAVAAGIVGTAASNPSAAALRQLTLMRPATGEVARDVPFWWGGAPYEQGLAELDWVMRDVQADETHPIDLRVYYLLAIVQAQFGGRPIFVTSGYRTHATNERLRRQGIDAARNSFHLHGRAVDIQMPGVEPRSMALLGLLLGLGGVGVYPKFVHLDSGPPRTWQG